MMKSIKHIGFIMDGNGRWATQQNKPRTYGHQQGAAVIKTILLACIEHQIQSVSMYAFSVENWSRPKKEVNFLLGLLSKKILNKQTINFFNQHNIKFIWKGFEENLSKSLILSLKKLEKLTQNHTSLNFQLLFNYGSTQSIIQNCKQLQAENKDIDLNNFIQINDPHQLGNVDLVIRTANEKRLSNFMLFECAYAEFIFSEKLWPDYDETEFVKNLEEYRHRTRKFGGTANSDK